MCHKLDPFVILLMLAEHTKGQCIPWTGIVGKELVSGTRFGFFYRNDTDWGQCVRECYLRTRCTAVNFMMTSHICRHYDVVPGEEKYKDNSSYLTGTVSMWTGVFAGTCASRPCKIDEKCLPTEPNYICLPWCDMPKLPLHSEKVLLGWDLNSWRLGGPAGFIIHRKKCRPRYMVPLGGLTARCLHNATWTLSNQQWACVEIKDCRDVKQCNASYTDGVYSVIQSGTNTSVTCSAMTSLSPTTSFTVDAGASVIIPECTRKRTE